MRHGLWRSLVARSVRVGEVASSNLASPIYKLPSRHTGGVPSRDLTAVADAWVAIWVNGDRDGFVELFHPDAELYLPRSVIEGTAYRGHDGVARAFDDAFDMWERVEIVGSWSEVCSRGELSLSKSRPRMHPRGGGPVVEYDAYWLLELRAGKIAYAHPYQDEREALAAFEQRAEEA